MENRLAHASAPPTPSMTEGQTHSDISTAKSSSTMSATLHQRLRDRKLELQREGKLAGDDEGSERSGADETTTTIELKKPRNAAKERRTASTTSTRKPSAQMGFREQEQHIAKLDKQNFDLKLRVYHQELKIREMHTEINQKNEEGEELMKLVDDQQKELDKREASLKEAVDSILLLQDKVRHLEKLASTPRPPSNRLTYTIDRRACEDAVPATTQKSASHRHSRSGPRLTVRRASHSDVPDDSNNEESDVDGAENGLDVPFKEELDAIDRDHHGLRARTMSALSRNTEDSRHHGEYMPPRSPAMSVLSEGDFESVYNWKEQSSIIDAHPPRPNSADLSELWTETARYEASKSQGLDIEQKVVDEEEEVKDQLLDEPARKSMSLAVSSRALADTSENLIPGLEVSNTFNRTTPTKVRQVPHRSVRKRNSDSSLANYGLGTPPNTEYGSPLSQAPAGMPSLRKTAAQSEDSPNNQTGKKVPATPLRRIRPALGSSEAHGSAFGSRSRERGFLSPRSEKVPSTAPFSARVGRFENYGFLDSQPSTPVLLGKKQHDAQRVQRRKDHPFPRSQHNEVDNAPGGPTSPTPAQPQVATRKDQQILEYIAQQRVSDWIDKAPRRAPVMAAPMFEDREGQGRQVYHSEHHPLPPTPPDTASAANSASRKTSGTLDAGRIMAEDLDAQPPRPNYKRAFESYPAHSHLRRSGAVQHSMATDVQDDLSQHAHADQTSHAPQSDRVRALGLAAGQTRDVVFNAYDAPIEPPRTMVSFAPVLETRVTFASAHEPEEEDENEDAVLVSPEEVPVGSKAHPPVSIATSRLGFAGRFRRRRGSSSTGSGSAGRAASAMQGSIAAMAAGQENEETAIEEGGEGAGEAKARRRASFTALKFSTLGRKIF